MVTYVAGGFVERARASENSAKFREGNVAARSFARAPPNKTASYAG